MKFFFIGLLLVASTSQAALPRIIQCYSPHYSINYYETIFTVGKSDGSSAPGRVMLILPSSNTREASRHEAYCRAGRGASLFECDVEVSAAIIYHISLTVPPGQKYYVAQAFRRDAPSHVIEMEMCVGHDHFKETGY